MTTLFRQAFGQSPARYRRIVASSPTPETEFGTERSTPAKWRLHRELVGVNSFSRESEDEEITGTDPFEMGDIELPAGKSTAFGESDATGLPGGSTIPGSPGAAL